MKQPSYSLGVGVQVVAELHHDLLHTDVHRHYPNLADLVVAPRTLLALTTMTTPMYIKSNTMVEGNMVHIVELGCQRVLTY
jgi:hypothetical protein